MMNETANETTQHPQQPLPFDDEAHEPIAYVLTAAAHRAVSPAGVPPLTAVVGPDAGETIDDRDTRPARARALRRGGITIGEIALQLGVDELIVQGWIDDGASLSPRAVTYRRTTTGDGVGASAPSGVDRGSPPANRTAHGETDTVAAPARAAAVQEARARLADDPGFASGVGLIAGIVEFDDTGFTLRLTSPEIAAHTIAWLTTYTATDASMIRVVLRLGSRAAGDLARHRWSAALGLAPCRVSVVRSRQLVDPTSVQALLRVVDPAAASRLAGWCDALLRETDDPVELAF